MVADKGFSATADAGHWGPGFGWLVYSTLLFWEGLGVTYILRRRYVEPMFAIVSGLLIFIIHVIVIQKCSSVVDSPTKTWTQERCYSVNGAHIGLGLYTFLVGGYEFLLHTPYWQSKIGHQAPAEHRQYPFLLSSVFLMTGLIMGGHEQDTMWQTMAHQYTGYFAFLLFALRSFSYQNPALTVATGVCGFIGALLFANASESAYKYWMQINAYNNVFGVPVSVPFLILILSAATITGCSLTFALLTLYRRFASESTQEYCASWDSHMSDCTNVLDRLDLLEPGHDDGAPSSDQHYNREQSTPLNRTGLDNDEQDEYTT